MPRWRYFAMSRSEKKKEGIHSLILRTQNLFPTVVRPEMQRIPIMRLSLYNETLYNLSNKFELAVLIQYIQFWDWENGGTARLNPIEQMFIRETKEENEDLFCRFWSFSFVFNPSVSNFTGFQLSFLPSSFNPPNIRIRLLCVCLDFLQSIEQGNRSANRSGWPPCVAVVATSRPHRGSRARR